LVQYAMVIDLNRCVGCHTCAVSCKNAWQVPSQEGRAWLKRLGPEQTPYGLSYTFYPGLCNHCNHPACVPACPVGKVEKDFTDPATGNTVTTRVAATWKDPVNGAVAIDRSRCIGCGACVKACPYQARYLRQPDSGRGTADKCSFCVDLPEEGQQPVCVHNCLAGARIFGDLHDPESAVSAALKKGAIRQGAGPKDLEPNVYYIGKPKDIFLLTKKGNPRS